MVKEPVLAWTFPGGNLKIVTVAGAAAAATIDLRPALDKFWVILYAHGYHDDTTSRTVNWQFYDGTTTITMGSFSAASTVYANIRRVDCAGTWDTVSSLFMAGYDAYWQFNVASIGAGKKAYIQAIVLEIDI